MQEELLKLENAALKAGSIPVARSPQILGKKATSRQIRDSFYSPSSPCLARFASGNLPFSRSLMFK